MKCIRMLHFIRVWTACFRLKQSSKTEVHLNLESLIGDPLICTITGSLIILKHMEDSIDPDEMYQNAAVHQGLDCLLQIKTIFID